MATIMCVNEETPESKEPEVQEMENRLNAIHQCAQWISSMSMLYGESGVATGTAISDMVDFRSMPSHVLLLCAVSARRSSPAKAVLQTIRGHQ